MALSLQLSINDSQTTIRVDGGLTLPQTGGVVQIENEEIHYLTCSTNELRGLTRGYNDTDAAAHVKGLEITVVSADPLAGSEPAGSTTEIQFNDAGAFGADSALTYSSETLTVPQVITDSIVGDTDLGIGANTGPITITSNTSAWTLKADGSIVLPNLDEDPETPVEGAIWYDSMTHAWRGFDGTDIVTFDVTPDA